ncbi:MAG: hypothetical protein AAFY26_24830 [Cyanobacteria bacterium J06638_22]
MKYIAFFIVCLLVAEYSVNFWHKRDPDAAESREFLATDPAVVSAVGVIQEVSFMQKLSYEGTPTDLGYVQFTYSVLSTTGESYLLRLRKYTGTTVFQVHELSEL